MNNADSQYLYWLREILNRGVVREGRNGKTMGLFGAQMRFNLQEGFPLLTTKRVFFRGVVAELLWFLKGDTNIKYLLEHNVHIWDEWADENGNLGPVYGSQWRSWPNIKIEQIKNSGEDIYSKEFRPEEYRSEITTEHIDQINNVINGLKKDPNGRRHIVTAWNPAEIENMALPPCHCLFQFHVAEGKLNCQLYQRSADWFLGVPFNIASYALLTHLVAREVGLEVGEFIHTFGDLHLYENHRQQAVTQLLRDPKELPTLVIGNPTDNIFNLKVEDITVFNYEPWPAIMAEVSV